jgi:hypothetical protein
MKDFILCLQGEIKRLQVRWCVKHIGSFKRLKYADHSLRRCPEGACAAALIGFLILEENYLPTMPLESAQSVEIVVE